MGSKDYRQREAKKPKKGAKKPAISNTILTPPVTVEVIKTKGKKASSFPEE